MRALRTRWRDCRPGYEFAAEGGRFSLRLVSGRVLGEEEISPSLLEPYRRATASADAQFRSGSDSRGRQPADAGKVKEVFLREAEAGAEDGSGSWRPGIPIEGENSARIKVSSDPGMVSTESGRSECRLVEDQGVRSSTR